MIPHSGNQAASSKHMRKVVAAVPGGPRLTPAPSLRLPAVRRDRQGDGRALAGGGRPHGREGGPDPERTAPELVEGVRAIAGGARRGIAEHGEHARRDRAEGDQEPGGCLQHDTKYEASLHVTPPQPAGNAPRCCGSLVDLMGDA